MDSLKDRWSRLFPHILVYGPADDLPRPAVLLFHGCGGVREHIRRYAKSAVEAGYRAFVVDSFGARGWSREFALTFVCTGILLPGLERAGDILATIHGVRDYPGVDPDRIVLAGWSHGGWGIMDLMTLPLTRKGEASLLDPNPALMTSVKGTFNVYPYVNFPARSRHKTWVHKARTFGVIARDDHLATVNIAMKAYGAAVKGGSDVEIWTVDATHAYDEPAIRPPTPMLYDAEKAAETHEKFKVFLRRCAED